MRFTASCTFRDTGNNRWLCISCLSVCTLTFSCEFVSNSLCVQQCVQLLDSSSIHTYQLGETRLAVLAGWIALGVPSKQLQSNPQNCLCSYQVITFD